MAKAKTTSARKPGTKKPGTKKPAAKPTKLVAKYPPFEEWQG